MTPTQSALIEQAERLALPEMWDVDAVESAPDLVAALAAELKRSLEENAKLRDRLAKCEPVIELVGTFQTLNRQAIADGHTEWTEAEYDAMDMIAAATLPEVTP